MARITFEEIAVKGVRRWIDADGKRRQESKKFYQTLNPFNKNAAGMIKSRDEIWVEILAKRDAWVASSAV